jgi:hypothetical protein
MPNQIEGIRSRVWGSGQSHKMEDTSATDLSEPSGGTVHCTLVSSTHARKGILVCILMRAHDM